MSKEICQIYMFAWYVLTTRTLLGIEWGWWPCYNHWPRTVMIGGMSQYIMSIQNMKNLPNGNDCERFNRWWSQQSVL